MLCNHFGVEYVKLVDLDKTRKLGVLTKKWNGERWKNRFALNPDRSIKGGIYARYSPGRNQKERSVGLAAVRIDDWDNLTGRDTPTFSSEGKS